MTIRVTRALPGITVMALLLSPAPPAVPPVKSAPTVRPSGPQRYLPTWRVGQFKGQAAYEAGIVAQINALRKSKGLRILKTDPRLKVAARQHTLEMFRRNYYGHASPVKAWKVPVRRACLAGFLDSYVSENLGLAAGYADPVPALIKSWVRSPGHYANLMDDKVTRTGVGAATAMHKGRMTTFATQLFAHNPVDFRGLLLRPEQRRIYRLSVSLKVDDGVDVKAWEGRRFIETVPRRGLGVRFVTELTRPLTKTRTFVLALRYASNKAPLACVRLVLDKTGRLKVKRNTWSPPCQRIKAASSALTKHEVRRWQLRGEARAEGRAGLKPKFYLNNSWGPVLPLSTRRWKAFIRELGPGKTTFSLVVGKAQKDYLILQPGLRPAFRCPVP